MAEPGSNSSSQALRHLGDWVGVPAFLHCVKELGVYVLEAQNPPLPSSISARLSEHCFIRVFHLHPSKELYSESPQLPIASGLGFRFVFVLFFFFRWWSEGYFSKQLRWQHKLSFSTFLLFLRGSGKGTAYITGLHFAILVIFWKTVSLFYVPVTEHTWLFSRVKFSNPKLPFAVFTQMYAL